jgi:Predicted ribosomal protein
MIQVVVKYNGNVIKHLEVSGHANFAENGNDIVCAGVSSLLLSNVMYAEKLDLGVFKTTQNNGHVIINVIQSDAILNHLLEAIVEGLCLMKEQYPEYIKIKIWR